MSRIRAISAIVIAAVAVYVIPIGQESSALAASGDSRLASRDTVDTIEREGRARVIVKLKTPRESRRRPQQSRLERAVRRQQIENVRARVSDRLRGTDHQLKREFDSLPYIAMEIDAQGLRRLESAADDVAGIFIG